MKQTAQPFVSVVTPVYNGEKYLAECVESVLAQTYTNWEYIILDNCSTDGTLEIANKYTHKDQRIKVLTNDEFLKQIPNWNASMQKISSDSKYCKVVHADDCLFPECLEKMVEKAEEYPTAGIVSSYRFLGSKVHGVDGEGLSHKTTFLKGREAGRRILKTPLFLFGSPTTLLYRSDLVRDKELFYDPTVIHADADNCYEILKKADFAFVHQLLTFSRLHNESTTTFCDHYNTIVLHYIYSVKKYGDYYLTSQEQEKVLSQKLTEQHRWLARSLFKGRGKDVLDYHKKELENMNLRMNWLKILTFYLRELAKVRPLIDWAKEKTSRWGDSNKDKETIDITIKNKQKETVLRKG